MYSSFVNRKGNGEMYTVDEVMTFVWANQGTTMIMAAICYGLGFLGYITHLWMQFKNKEGLFPFWNHCLYIGVDFAFAVFAFRQWLEIGWFFWIALAIGNMVFILVELWSLKNCVDNERQEIFGRYLGGAEVSKAYAWKRSLLMYLAGIIIVQAVRIVIGDPMCMFIFLLTNSVGAVCVPLALNRADHYSPGMKFLSIANLAGIIYSYMPAGIGYYSTMVSALNTPWATAAGVVLVLFALWGVYLAFFKVPRKAE